MKHYKEAKLSELSYQTVVEVSGILDGTGEAFITRPEWDGVHFMVKDDYFILTKDNNLIANPKEVYDLDKSDWMIVEVTDEAKELINTLVSNYYDRKRSRLRRRKE